MLKEKYPTVFKGLGSLGMYHITLEDKPTPIINPSRRIPHSLKEQLKQTIDKNVKSWRTGEGRPTNRLGEQPGCYPTDVSRPEGPKQSNQKGTLQHTNHARHRK